MHLNSERKETFERLGRSCCCLSCLCRLFLFILGLLEKCLYIVLAVLNICVNISLIIVQSICPLMKHFLTGYAQPINKKCENVTGIFQRYKYAGAMLVWYLIIWCGANLYVFNTIMLIYSFFLYLTIVAITFNPSYGVPFIVIVLSLFSYFVMFYEEFQSDYKHLLDIIFEILDEHFIKKTTASDDLENSSFDLKKSIKVWQIDATIFYQLCTRYVPLSRKCVFLFIKLAFTIKSIVSELLSMLWENLAPA